MFWRVVRRSAALLAVWLIFSAAGWTQQFSLTIDDFSASGFSARGLALRLGATNAGGTQAADIAIATLAIGAQTWKNVKLECPALRIERYLVDCREGVLHIDGKIPLSFSYTTDKRVLDVVLKPATDESWRVVLRPAKQGNDVEVAIKNGKAPRLAIWLPKDMPRISSGDINGSIRYRGDGSIDAQLKISTLAFSDAQGLRAGEKNAFNLEMRAQPDGKRLRWESSATWEAGEIFWQPVYIKAATQRLVASGWWESGQLRIDQGELRYPQIGDIVFNATYDAAAGKLAHASLKSNMLKGAPLYENVLKAFLQQTAFSDLRVEGGIGISAEFGTQGWRSVDVKLEDFSFEDKSQRFALFDIDGSIPWRADANSQADISIKGGELLTMPVGGFSLPVLMHGPRVELKHLVVPLLDGKIEVRNFVARAGTASWYWQFGGEISGISMDKFTQALGIPVMHGTLSATIPMVRNVKSSLRVDGAFLFKVFDGTVEAKNVVLLDLFDKAPRVQADVTMRNLDLDLVTRAFSFGNITGRLDAQVAGLELVNWQPVKFDAKVESSPGDYPRKISQKAVQSISALGGAGAAAAIQRSFLRFFEQFGYQKLGWSCRLRDSVCEMGGVENAPQGYVLVKGGGIPAISVMGYNRQVNWQELVQRLKRVTQGDVKPVVE